MAYTVSKQSFGELVRRVLASLPSEFARRIEAVVVEVRDRPTQRMLREVGLPEGETLLGLYVGRPTTQRSVEESEVLPEVIYLFQKEIEAISADAQELEEEVRKTLLHEIGHHFGMDEQDLEELGYQ